MEAFDLFLATVEDVTYLALHHPGLSAVGGLFSLYLMVRFYLSLTLGVYEGQEDMEGKTVIVTGASAGIGKATAFDLARRKAKVLLACRDVSKAQKVADYIKVATGNQNVVVKQMDLCSFESVRKCAEEILDTEERIDVLINNAGISSVGTPGLLTEDKHEMLMQTNHLAPFLFTLLLIDLLKASAPSRVVNVSSEAHGFGKVDVENLENHGKNASELQIYATTKLANVFFTNELARRLAGTGVTVNSLHPGCVDSDILVKAKGVFKVMCLIVFKLFGKTCEEGAQTSIMLAVDPNLEKTTGKYFSDCKVKTPKGTGNDNELAKKLFQASERIVGVSYPPSS